MSEIVDTNGEVVENSISGKQANALPEIYESLRDVKNLGYKVNERINDPDTEKWAELLNNIEIFGESLGKVQGVAVKAPLKQYNNRISANDRAVPLYEVSDREQSFLKDNKVMDLLEESTTTWWDYAGDVQVPTDKEGECLPVVVTTDEYSERYHNFEDAKEILAGVLSRIDGVTKEGFLDETDDTAGSDSTTNNDSEPEDMSPEGQIHGVGSKVAGKVEDSFYTFTAERFPSKDEWHTSIEESAYYVEDEWESPSEKRKVIGESEETSTPDLTTGDLLDRASEVEMPDMEQELFMSRLNEDKLYDAESILSRHE